MTLLDKVKQKISPANKKSNLYFELWNIGIPIKERRKIIENAYSPFGRIFLEPMLLDMAIKEIKEKKLSGQEASDKIKGYLNIPYPSNYKTEVLGV